MISSASNITITRSIISAIVLLILSSQAFADTWSPIDSVYFTNANQYYGAQLAVAEVRFLPDTSQQAESTLLVAITDGSAGVRLYSFDTGDSTLIFEDEVSVDVDSITSPIAWTPTFMDLDVVGTG